MSSGYSDIFDSFSSEDTFSILNSTGGQMSMSPNRTVVGTQRTEEPVDDSPQGGGGNDGPSLEAGLPSPPSSRSSSSSSKSSSSPPSRSKSVESQKSQSASQNSRHSSLLRAKCAASMHEEEGEEEDNKSNPPSSKAPSSHHSNSAHSSPHSTPHRSVSSSSSTPHSSRSSSPHDDDKDAMPPVDEDNAALSTPTLERKAIGEEQPRIDSSRSLSPGSRSFSPGGTLRKKHMFSKYPDLAKSSSSGSSAVSPSSSSSGTPPVSRSSSASLHSVAKSIDNSQMGASASGAGKSDAPKTSATTTLANADKQEPSKPKKGGISGSKPTGSKVPDIRANNHHPSPVPKKSIAPKPGSAGVKTLRTSHVATTPKRTPAVASTTPHQNGSPQQDQSPKDKDQGRVFRAVPPSCRNILMGMVNANSDDSDDSDDAFAAPHRRPDTTSEVAADGGVDTPPSSSAVAAIEDKSGDVQEVDKAASQGPSHYPRQPRVTSARQKYLNSIDMRFLVSAPLLGSGRVGKKLNPADKAPIPPPSPASISPRSTKSRPSTGNGVKLKPKLSSSSPPTPQMEDGATTSPTTSSIPAESPEWTVNNKVEDTGVSSTATSPAKSNANKNKSGGTKGGGTLKKTAWRVIPLNYLSTLHESAEQRREKREEKVAKEEEKKEAAKKEQHAKVAAPSERLYSKGAVPEDRMERYRELAREAGEDFAEDPESLAGNGVNNNDDDAESKTPESGARLNAAKWVLTRTVASPSGGGGVTAPTYGTQYDTTTQFLHLRPRENDEVFDRLSTIKRSKMNPYKDVQIGGKPLDPLSDEGLTELNDRMYGRWVERKEKEKKVREEKEAAAKAKPTKKVSAEEIAERMYAQPVEMKAKKLEILRKKQDAEITRLARTIDVGGKASPRQAPAMVSLKSVSQRQYYEPMAKKAAWRETMLKTLADEDKKASVSKGPIDSSRWDEIIERNVYEVLAKRPPTATPAPPKSTPKKTGRTRPQTAQ